MGIAVGIDLGTSNSTVAAFIQGKHQVIADENGHRLTPSVVSFGKDNKILIGDDARSQLFANPKRTVSSVKRLIGRKIFSPEVKKSQVLLPYSLVEAADQNVAIEIDEQHYLPQEISSLILKRMKEIAETKLGKEVTHAVVTVPAYFNDNQRQATADACKIAGLEVLRMINEPTAAALAYGFGKELDEKVAIYDLGGGTFDISILQLKGQVFEVLSTAGDTFLGGDDFDDRIIDLCAESFLQQHEIDLRTIPQALPLLRQNAERAKRKLSYSEKTDIYIPGILKEENRVLDLHYSLTRDAFEKACLDLIQRTFTVCDEALRSAGIRAGDLNAVILVGGPTKMSIIQLAAERYFGKAPMKDLNPDEVVAIGAAIQAHQLEGNVDIDSQTPVSSPASLLLDVTPLDLGIATVGGFVETLIEANTPIPVQSSRAFTTTRDHQKSVAIRIFQGRNRKESESTQLGEFEFAGFKDGKAGDASIDVTFSINTDGIVEVSAKDQATGCEQSVTVKMAAAMSKENMQKSESRASQHKQVQLKSKFKDHKKVIFCIPAAKKHTYEEGFVKDLSPNLESFVLESESGLGEPKIIERSKIAWLLTVEDFANTPRYIQAATEKPSQFFVPPRSQLYQFTLNDGSKVFGQASMPKVREMGFWMEPYFSRDELPGKMYLYSDKIVEALPLNL
jgi:molecular chaperone DnaK